MGLRSKLMGLLLVLFVLPLAGLGSASYWVLKSRLYADALTNKEMLTAQVARSLRYEIERGQRDFSLMVGHVDVVAGLHQFKQVPAEGARQLRGILARFLELNSSLIEMGVYSASGKLIESSVTRSSYFADHFGLAGRIDPAMLQGVDDVYVEEFERLQGLQVFRVVIPIAGERGESIGFLALNATGGGLEQAIAGRGSATTALFLCDGDGVVITHTEGIDFAVLPVALQSLLQGTAGRVHRQRLELDGRSLEVGLQPLGGDIWLGTQLDLDAVYADIRQLILSLLLTGSVLIVLVVVIFFWRTARMVIRPLEQLIGATRKISAGEYLPAIDIDSDDEVGELANSFRIMGMRLKETSDRVNQLAYFDPLTKLPNRETLRRSLQQMIASAERQKGLLAILFIDLDDFKKVNDRLGHAAGDELLVVVGERLSQSLRSSDLLFGGAEGDSDDPEQRSLISRRGGDEFNAVVGQLKSARDIALIAERLIVDINEPMVLAGSPVSVSASVGVAIYPYDGRDADTLLRNADLAMYEAKSLGKNKYYLFTESINSQVHERLEMEQRIAQGLQRSEFELHFQPKILLEGGGIAGFEALIRWKNPDEGLVPPGEFIPLAEESQLIHDIGRWTLAETFDHLQEWEPELPEGMRVAVNVSPRQLVQDSFADNLISLAEQFGVSLQRLEIELTETSVLTDERMVKRHLDKLRRAGVRINLDDFGTGFSSLTFLRNLPIDAVKIDRSFVQRIEDGGQSREIVAAILDLCRKLGLETIAEGVESEAQSDFLRQFGCCQGQGYLFCRPLRDDQVLAFLRRERRPRRETGAG